MTEDSKQKVYGRDGESLEGEVISCEECCEVDKD